MLIVPAVDIKGGEVVRLWQGDFEKFTSYSKDPVYVAKGWEEKGARLIHIVDLDGAKAGRPKSLDIAASIAEAVSVPVELGGGIRTKDDVRDVLDEGIAYVILGTAACGDGPFLREMVASYGDKIIVSIDAREGAVYSKGWTEKAQQDTLDLARNVQDLGIGRLIYTDISKDGTLIGPNLEAIERFVKLLSAEIFVAGGIGSMEDLISLKRFEEDGLAGVIIGKALYEGKVNLEEAITLCQ